MTDTINWHWHRLGAGLFGLLLAASTQAAEPDFDVAAMQRDIEIFAGVLRGSLELDNPGGVFGSRGNSVSGYYLAGQGVVMELHTPLRGRRGGLGLHGLQGALQGNIDELSVQLAELRQQNTVPLTRPDADRMRAAMALSLSADGSAEYYREVLQRLDDDVDVETINRELRSAENSLRLLVDSAQLRDELEQRWLPQQGDLRQRMAQLVRQRQQLLQQVREASLDTALQPDTAMREQWQQQIAVLERQSGVLREQARDQAEILRQRSEQAREQSLVAWRQQVDVFEQRLFAVLCDYGASLRQLPDDQFMTLLLSGLGGSGEPGQRLNRLHVLSRQALMQCQRGEITAAQLQQRALSYAM